MAEDDPTQGTAPPKAPIRFKKRRKIENKVVRQPSPESADEQQPATVVKKPAPHGPVNKKLLITSSKPKPLQPLDQTAVSPIEKKPASNLNVLANRFVKATGHVADENDDLMNAYIEAGMREWQKNPDAPLPDTWTIASKTATMLPRGGTLPISPYLQTNPTASLTTTISPNPLAPGMGAAKSASNDDRQAASMGKLFEVDLGPEARLENIRRTEAALKKMAGQEAKEEEPTGLTGPRGQKRRRGREIKPRTAEDEERDRKVEELMKQAPAYHFAVEPEPFVPETDQPTDALLAERFQKEFLESQENSRASRKPAAANKGVGDLPKGPKLGGSRAARAQMARQEKEKK